MVKQGDYSIFKQLNPLTAKDELARSGNLGLI